MIPFKAMVVFTFLLAEMMPCLWSLVLTALVILKPSSFTLI
ncbi:hypothetical protein T01_10010 [Trichinella spiralis]|uniref:Uncharacterized protein n=1 Tax=Trichinella spiralis TaxID=6334 RepID=A0A0V1ANB8_TRISP|nr:hypothetical protein T01_10010 [Trichinella spiralis]